MIEIYVGLTLLGLGYIVNQNRPVKSNPIKQVNANEMNSSRNIYDSSFVDTAKKIENKLASQKYASSIPAPSGQTSNRIVPPPLEGKVSSIKSQLSGLEMPESDFKHNNMQPFYKGTLKHMRLDAPSQHLERFTGIQAFYKPKMEVENFFKPEASLGTAGTSGTPASAAFMQTRMEAPRVQNNTLPFEQVRVGPAINRGFTSEPTGGYQQYDVRDFAMPRSTDEIRAANKPKVSYEARTVDGQKGSVPANIGCVNKNKVDTYYKNNPDRYFRTTGAFLKEKQQPQVNAKYTSKQDTTTKPYSGVPYQATMGKLKAPAVNVPHRKQLGAFAVTNTSLAHQPNQKGDDYGKAAIQIYDNERSVTTTRTYQGNLTSIVKSFTAPIEDLIKITKKEYTVEASREYGQLQATMPSKPTIYDPNAVMRTTIKETLIHDSDILNLKGASKITVYDPNDIARTTLKDTLLHDAPHMNLKGERSHGIVYDPNETARPTVRQTVAPIDATRNFGTSGRQQAAPAYDPNDTTRTTMKETTIDAPREFGNPDRQENFTGGYQNEDYDAPETQRHVITKDSDYQGNPNFQASDAYQVAQTVSNPRETQKEHLADNEYYGSAGDKTSHKPMSYEDAYNATFDPLREELNVGREPTQSGVKVSSGAEDIVLNSRKIECDQIATRSQNNADHIVNVPLDPHSTALTRGRNEYDDDDRLDIDILDVFKENEFTQALDSVA